MKRKAAEIAAWRKRTREREQAKIAAERVRLNGLSPGVSLEVTTRAATTNHSQDGEVSRPSEPR